MKFYYIDGKYHIISSDNEPEGTLGKYFAHVYTVSLYKQHKWNSRHPIEGCVTALDNLEPNDLNPKVLAKYKALQKKYPIKESDAEDLIFKNTLKTAEEFRKICEDEPSDYPLILEFEVTFYIKGNSTAIVLPKSAKQGGTIAEHFAHAIITACSTPYYFRMGDKTIPCWAKRESTFSIIMKQTKETTEIYNYLFAHELYGKVTESDSSIWDEPNATSIIEYLPCLYEFANEDTLNKKPILSLPAPNILDKKTFEEQNADATSSLSVTESPLLFSAAANGFTSIVTYTLSDFPATAAVTGESEVKPGIGQKESKPHFP